MIPERSNADYREQQLVKECHGYEEAETVLNALKICIKDNGIDAKFIRRGNRIYVGMPLSETHKQIESGDFFIEYLLSAPQNFMPTKVLGIDYVGSNKNFNPQPYSR